MLIFVLLISSSIIIAGCIERKNNEGDTAHPTYSTTEKLGFTPSQTLIAQSSLQNPEPQRIFLSTRPVEYPNIRLPNRMDLYGSDMPWKDPNTVAFAYIEGSKGGITQEFFIPYGLWMMNISVMANQIPTDVWFRTGLCYASNGTIIDGGEMLQGGTMYKLIETSNTDMYLIIDTHNIYSYRINFETTRDYYNQVRSFGLNTDITRY